MMIEIPLHELESLKRFMDNQEHDHALQYLTEILVRVEGENNWQSILMEVYADMTNQENLDVIHNDYLDGWNLGANGKGYPNDYDSAARQLGFNRGRLGWPEPEDEMPKAVEG